MKSLQERIEKMQKLMETLDTDILYLKQVWEELKNIDIRRKEFESYIEHDWYSDYQNNPDLWKYTLLNEDSAYNTIQDMYFQKIELLKKISLSL